MTNALYDTLFAAHAGSDRPFLMLRDGTAISYDVFLRKAAQIAHALTSLGAEPGDRVALQTAKTPMALMTYAACVQAGLVYLPLNPAYTAAEVGYFVTDARPAVLICDSTGVVALAEIAAPVGAQIVTLDADGTGTLADLAEGQPETFDAIARQADDLAAILYTSGTTGRSKGAMLSQANLLSNAQALTDLWQFTADDVLLHALPIFHTHGLFVATNITLLAGGAMIFLPKFDVDDLITHMPAATTMMGVPTFYTRLLGHRDFGADLSGHMRLFVSGSAPLLAETHAAFTHRTGHRILERYGMTETNMSTSNPYDGDRRAGTVGLPLPGVTAKVCDDAGTQLPRGEIGTLEVRGPNVFQGYWQMPEKTAAELRPDGFFITGDLAQQDADGYVTIVGRGKDLIIAGGLNIYPKEVETVLDAQPGIVESAVIGVPHPDLGEAAVGILAATGDVDVTAVMDALDGTLARFKHPRKLVVVDALPRNTMGKVQKAALRQTYAGLFG